MEVKWADVPFNLILKTFLQDVLEEIEQERQKKAILREGELLVENAEDDSGVVLVACKDERTCMQLEDFVLKGPDQVMREEWEKYLRSRVELWRKVELHGIQPCNKWKKREPKGFGVLDGVKPATLAENAEASSISKLEHDALLAAASAISDPTEDVLFADHCQACGGGGGHGKRRGKGRTKNSLVVEISGSKDNNMKTEENGKSEMSGSENEGQRDKTDPVVAVGASDSVENSAYLGKRVPLKHKLGTDGTGPRHDKPIPAVHFHALESDQPILDILKPSIIIVYQPDVSFVREIENFKAENPERKLKVYFLFYEDSTEVQKFEASIRRENGAFESLIRQKSLMMIPVDQDGRCLGLSTSTEPQTITSQNSITRKAGGRKEVQREMQVVVDMREFMSSLPNVLHQKGMRIMPVNLEVGDYVLSPLICVERKSILDLFQSFTSGRLYHQVETMARYYRIPVLLIEFSQDELFIPEPKITIHLLLSS